MGIVEPLPAEGLLVQHGETVGYESVIKVSMAKLVCIKSEIYPRWYLSLWFYKRSNEICPPDYYFSLPYGCYACHLGCVEGILQSRVSTNADQTLLGIPR